MPFLDACFEKNVRLFDYELLKAPKEVRVPVGVRVYVSVCVYKLVHAHHRS